MKLVELDCGNDVTHLSGYVAGNPETMLEYARGMQDWTQACLGSQDITLKQAEGIYLKLALDLANGMGDYYSAFNAEVQRRTPNVASDDDAYPYPPQANPPQANPPQEAIILNARIDHILQNNPEGNLQMIFEQGRGYESVLSQLDQLIGISGKPVKDPNIADMYEDYNHVVKAIRNAVQDAHNCSQDKMPGALERV